MYVDVAERQGNGLQPRFMQVRVLSSTPTNQQLDVF